MGRVKRWQIAVFVAAMVVLAASVILTFGRGGWGWWGGGSVQLASTIVMVDVTNGDLFEYAVSGRRSVMVPGEHPDTGRIVLLPVHRREDGRWVIGLREREALDTLDGPPAAVNRQTGEVTVSGDRPRRVR